MIEYSTRRISNDYRSLTQLGRVVQLDSKMIKVELKTAVNVETSIRYDHNQDPAVFKAIKINYKKNEERIGFSLLFFFSL